MDFNDRRPEAAVPALTEHVRTARKSIMALGKLNLGTTAGLNAAIRHQSTIKQAHEALYTAGRHDLVGALIDEQNTSERLREAKTKGQERPELHVRLKAARTQLRHV